MAITIKICGLSTPATMAAALEAEADMVGLVFHPRSPRHVSAEQAEGLARQARGRARIVALVVDLDDDTLRSIASAVKPDLIQCHGGEDAARLAAIRELTGLPVIKAVGVAAPEDLVGIAPLAAAADHLIIDAKAPKGAAYPGGHGQPFNWRILAALPRELGFMLSGGLDPASVGEAITMVRGMGLALEGVDVSSGAESAPGLKDPARIAAFIDAARRAGGP